MRWLIALLLVVPSSYLAITAVQVWRSAHTDDAADVAATAPADAIIVLGAAQYDGEPSAALRGRLDRAAELYSQGLAPLVVVTGGRREGDRFTEAAAGAAYLEGRGVPGGAIERETTGSSSYLSLAATARFLTQDGATDVILVSDPFHNHRIRAIAEEVGLDARVAASTTSPFQGTSQLRPIVRETVAVAIGRIVGYQRAERLAIRFADFRR